MGIMMAHGSMIGAMLCIGNLDFSQYMSWERPGSASLHRVSFMRCNISCILSWYDMQLLTLH